MNFLAYLDQDLLWRTHTGEYLPIRLMNLQHRENCQRFLDQRADAYCLRYQTALDRLNPPENLQSVSENESLNARAWIRHTALYRGLGGEPDND